MAPEIRKRIALARNLALLAALVAVTPAGVRSLRQFLREDAFATKERSRASSTPFAIKLEDVEFRHYDGHALIAAADAKTVEVMRDRQTLALQGIKNGVYAGKEEMVRFSSTDALWRAQRKLLTIEGNVRLKNKDLNVTCGHATLDNLAGKIDAQEDVVGTAYGGKLRAAHLKYATKTGAATAGPVEWSGMLALNLQEEEGEAPRTNWKIRGEKFSYSGKNSQVADYTNAYATDDEIILIAPKVSHDRKTDVVTATGRVQYFSVKANLVADKVVVYRKERRAVLTGGVQMLVKPKKEQQGKPKVEQMPAFQPLNPEQVKPSPLPGKLTPEQKKQLEQIRDNKTLQDFPMAVVSDKIEYWYGRGARRAVITGEPQARQVLSEGRWRHMWSFVAYYDGEKEILKLVSTKGKKDTRMKNSIGDDMMADWMDLSTKEDDETLNGAGFTGDLVPLDDDEETGGTGTPSQPATPPAPAKTGTTGGGTTTTGGDKKTGGGTKKG